MKKLLFVLMIGALVACGTPNKEQQATKHLMEQEDIDPSGGADAYAFSGDHVNSPYFNAPDVYNMKNSESLTILENYESFQQTTEYTCGAASALTVYNYFGIEGYTEESIALGMKVSMDSELENAELGSANKFYDYGANVKKIVEYFDTDESINVVETSYVKDYKESDLLGEQSGVSGNDMGNLPPTFASTALYASENKDDTESFVEDASDSYFVQWVTNHLKAGRPIMVEWGDWDGHWVTIIGYDTMGTPGVGDDVLIFSDPYDTSDHYQDGYAFAPVEKFFNMWKDRNIAPKPYQLQPFVVLEKAEK